MNTEIHAAETEEPRNIVLQDGLWIDADTGEVVGLAEPFQVTDEDSANWVLEKLLNAEADIARERMKLRAVEERAQANIKRHERRVEWLKARFGPELEAYAAQALEGKKSRTLSLLFGKLAFRKKAGGLRLADEALALEWAKKHCPDAVKVTEAFRISAIPAEEATRLTGLDQEVLDVTGLRYEGPSETFSISTGVNS